MSDTRDKVLENHPLPWKVGESNEASASICSGDHIVCRIKPALAFPSSGSWPEQIAAVICDAMNGTQPPPAPEVEMVDVLLELPSGIRVPTKYPRHLVNASKEP